MERIIRVLVVDDSAYVRKVVSAMLGRSPFIEVVGTARDGEEALAKVRELDPDVVTLDLLMPRLDGVGFLRRVMQEHPVPVVVCSIASEGGRAVLEAMEAGAIEFVQKPTALATDKLYEISSQLVEKVKAAAAAPVEKLRPAAPPAPTEAVNSVPDCGRVEAVLLGASTGGPQALRLVLSALPADFPVPVALVLHMPEGYTRLYAERLDEELPLRVKEAEEGDVMTPGQVLVARAGRHLRLVRDPDGRVRARLELRPLDLTHRPAVDVLFRSGAEVYGAGALGVVLTGMGQDGLEGARAVKACGGHVFTEAAETCVVYGMPRAVAEAGLSDFSTRLERMPGAILKAVCHGRHTHSR